MFILVVCILVIGYVNSVVCIWADCLVCGFGLLGCVCLFA